jgi:hypothetical protein
MISKCLHTATGLIALAAWWVYLQGRLGFYHAASVVSTPSDVNIALGWVMATAALGPLILAYLYWAWKPRP